MVLRQLICTHVEIESPALKFDRGNEDLSALRLQLDQAPAYSVCFSNIFFAGLSFARVRPVGVQENSKSTRSTSRIL